MEKHNILPIGSVVKLKNVQHPIMIIGINTTFLDKKYLYSGVLYPEGFSDEENVIPFNDEHIEEVFFLGTLNFS